jgi:hypothetical protein
LPYTGKQNTYFGGGYVFQIQGSTDEIISNMSTLNQLSWINKQTAAIFVEFTLYNTNVNLFQACMILFEINLAGAFQSTAQLTSLNLFEINNSGLFSFKILMNIVYIIFVIIIMLVEIKHFIKIGWRKYFSDFYNYIEIIIICFSWAAFSMFLYRIYAAHDVGNKISKNFTNTFINLQTAVYFSTLFNYFLGICAAFSCFRFLKILRYVRRILVFVRAIKRSCQEFISFGVVFTVVYLAFMQMFYMFLNNKYSEFRSMAKSIMTGFEMILGRKCELFLDERTLWLASLYIIFVTCVIFALINVFLTIIYDSYVMSSVEVFGDSIQHSGRALTIQKNMSHLLEPIANDETYEDPELFGYVKYFFGSLFGPLFKNKTNESRQNIPQYVENWNKLISRFDESLHRFKKSKTFYKSTYFFFKLS